MWIFRKMLDIRVLVCYICGMNNLKNYQIMLEKIVEICRKWFGTKHVSVVENVEIETPVKAEAKNRKRTLLDDL